MSETIFEAKWEELLPESLKTDKRINAMALAIAEQKRKIANEICRTAFWNQLKMAPDEVLDALAYDLNVKWYDGSMDREKKTKTIENAVKVYKALGTPQAVYDAIAAIYPGDVKIEEWYQYGGEAHRFRLVLNETGDYEELLKVVERSKRASAWLEALRGNTRITGATFTGGYIEIKSIISMQSGSGSAEEEIPDNALRDESGNILTDEAGNTLIEEE